MIQYFYNQDGDYDPNNPDNWSASVIYYSPTGGPQPGDTLYIAGGGYPGPMSWSITPSGGTWNLPANVTVYFSGSTFGGYSTTVNFAINTSAGGITIYSDSQTTWTGGGSCGVVVDSVGSIFNVDPGNGINGSSNTQYYGNITSGITDDGSGILGSGYSFGGVIQWNGDLTSSNAYNPSFIGAILTVPGQIGNDVGAYFDPATTVYCNTILDGFWNGSTIYQSGDPCTWLVQPANISNPVNAYVTPVVGSALYGSIIINNPYVPGGNFQIYFPAQGYVTQSSGATFLISDSSPDADNGTYLEATTAQVENGVSFGPNGSYTGTYSGGGGSGGEYTTDGSMNIKQNSSAYNIPFFMSSSTTPGQGVTGLSPTVTISKDGGAFATPSGAVSEIGNGWYQVAGNSSDSSVLGALAILATGTGAQNYTAIHQVIIDPQFNAAEILANPSNLLATDSSGNISISSATQTAIASAAGTAAANDILATPSHKLTTDSSGDVTLSSTSQSAVATAVAGAILVTPSDKLATDASGNVSLSSATQTAIANAAGTAAANDILSTPTNKLATDSSGNVSLSSATQTSIATASGTAAASDILSNPSYKLSTDSSGNVAISSATQTAIANAAGTAAASDILATPTHKLSTDSSGNVAISSASQSAIASTAAASTVQAMLINPSDPLLTNSSGQVETSNPSLVRSITISQS